MFGSTIAKTKTVYQLEVAECGAASLAMVLNYFGLPVPLERLRIDADVSRDGCKAGNILHAARKYGLDCHGYKRDADGLDSLPVPSIIYWDFNHFVVFEGRKDDAFYINDPARGRRKLSKEEFTDSYSNVVLTFIPTEELQNKIELEKTIPSKKNITLGNFWKSFFIISLQVFYALITIAIPVFGQLLIDRLVNNYKIMNSTWCLALILTTIAVQLLVLIFANRISDKYQKEQVLFSTKKFIDKLFRLPSSYYEQRYTEDIVGRASSNAKQSRYLSKTFLENISSTIIVFLYLVVFLFYNVGIAFAIIVGSALSILLAHFVSSSSSNEYIQLARKYEEMSAVISTGVSLNATIKASGREGEYSARALEAQKDIHSIIKKIEAKHRISKTITDILKPAIALLIVLLGCGFAIKNKISVGAFIAIIILFERYFDYVGKLAKISAKYQSMQLNIAKTQDVLNYPVDDKFSKKSLSDVSIKKLDGNIEIKNLTFGYSKDNEPVIDNLSFRINCGEMVGIVGDSHSGKSTLVKLISGLYSADEGDILFDKKTIKKIPNEILSSSISIVSQTDPLFEGTVRENIKMWNKKIFDSDMVIAARDALIHDVIMKREGDYDYFINENATNISGGEKQRIEIARGLATNPSILILDNATSALDSITEAEIMKNIKKRGCTCIVISNRRSTLKYCSEIIDITNGKQY